MKYFQLEFHFPLPTFRVASGNRFICLALNSSGHYYRYHTCIFHASLLLLNSLKCLHEITFNWVLSIFSFPCSSFQFLKQFIFLRSSLQTLGGKKEVSCFQLEVMIMENPVRLSTGKQFQFFLIFFWEQSFMVLNFNCVMSNVITAHMVNAFKVIKAVSGLNYNYGNHSNMNKKYVFINIWSRSKEKFCGKESE